MGVSFHGGDIRLCTSHSELPINSLATRDSNGNCKFGNRIPSQLKFIINSVIRTLDCYCDAHCLKSDTTIAHPVAERYKLNIFKTTWGGHAISTHLQKQHSSNNCPTYLFNNQDGYVSLWTALMHLLKRTCSSKLLCNAPVDNMS